MSDYRDNVFPTGGYTATHRGFDTGHMTPNFEIMEGMRFGPYFPAPYLSIVRKEEYFDDYIVIGAGKAVACDSAGWLVPAGFKLLIAAGGGAGPQYTQLDIDMGIKNAQGATPSVGDYVVDSMIAAGRTVGHCAGAISYNAYMLSGSDPNNPATYRFHNYSKQASVAVLTDYLLEFPVEPLKRTKHCMAAITISLPVADPYLVDLGHDTVLFKFDGPFAMTVTLNSERVHAEDITFNAGAGAGGVDQLEFSAAFRTALKDDDVLEICYFFEETFYKTPWAGMATWKGAAVCGDKVTYDADSNWVAYAPGTIGDTSVADESAAIAAEIAATLEVVGQVTKVHTNYPKQLLDHVKTAFDDRLTGKIVDGETGLDLPLNKLPGSATNGLPSNIFFAGGDGDTGVVRFNLNVT